jgi:hypothetical protein
MIRAIANRRIADLPSAFSLSAFALVAFFLATVGVGARLLHFVRNDSLMMDECSLCRNVQYRGFRDFARPLDHDQAAPLGFLILEKAVVTAVGMDDRSVRIVPLICGLTTIPLALITALVIFNPSFNPCAAILVIGLTCLNWAIIDYSAVAKQYTLESVITFLMLWVLAASVGARSASSTSTRARSLLVLSPALVWFSYGAVFVTAAIGATLIARALVLRRHEAVRTAILFSLSAAIQMSAFYALSIRPAATNGRLLGFWFDGAPAPSTPRLAAIWLWIAFIRICQILMHLYGSTILLGIALVLFAAFTGIAIQAARRLDWFWIAIIVSVLLCMAASAMHRYPFQDRLIIFLVPVLILICGRTVELLEKTFSGRWSSHGRGYFVNVAVDTLCQWSEKRPSG